MKTAQTKIWNYRFGTIATSAVLIAAGGLFLAHNFGRIDDDLFHQLVSWKTLLIAMGLINIVKGHFFWGGLLFITGTYFMIPQEIGIRQFWPLLLIAGGIMILFRLKRPLAVPFMSVHRRCRRRFFRAHGANRVESSTVEDGYVRSEVVFGAARHIVLDPVFRGANLDVSFGNIVLDLMRTQLEGDETLIQMDNNFGGVELYLPSSWNVILEVESIFGSCMDHRFRSPEVDVSHKLIIRGEVTFGGLEIKS
jgi:predicted membrane protein